MKNDYPESFETLFKELAGQAGIKAGELQMLLRIMLVGEKLGPGVFAIASAIGNTETVKRIDDAIAVFNSLGK